MQADEQDKLESDENQTEIEEGKDVESIKEEVKEADDVAKDEQLVKTPFLQEAQEDAQLTVSALCPPAARDLYILASLCNSS